MSRERRILKFYLEDEVIALRPGYISVEKNWSSMHGEQRNHFLKVGGYFWRPTISVEVS